MKKIFQFFNMVFKRNKKKAKSKKVKHVRAIKKKDDFKFINSDDLPDTIENGIIYIIGEDGYNWAVALKCPCGCEETIQLNLLPEARPCWKIIYHKDKTMSLSPSIHRIVNCKSHFSVTRNILSWWGKSRYENNW